MVRVKYNKESIVPETAGPIKPLMKGLSRIAFSLFLLPHPIYAAENRISSAKEIPIEFVADKSTSARRVLSRTLASRNLGVVYASAIAEGREEKPVLSEQLTVSTRSGMPDTDLEFDEGFAGSPVPELEIGKSRLSFETGHVAEITPGREAPETLKAIASVNFDAGFPDEELSVLGLEGEGFRPPSAPRSSAGYRTESLPPTAASAAAAMPAVTRSSVKPSMLPPSPLGQAVSSGVTGEIEGKCAAVSFDGGGCRVLLSAATIWHIQAEFKINLPGSADLLAGTSAGGLNALGYASGMSPKEVVDFYRDRGRDIFSRSTWRRLTSFSGLGRAKYSRRKADRLLKEQFGDLTMAGLDTDIVVPAWDVRLGRPVLFTTREARENPHKNFRLRDVAAATSAAPSFFGVAKFEGPDGVQNYMADGGLFANNPSVILSAEMVKKGYDPKKSIVLSLGSGEVSLARDGASMTDAGALQWGPGEMIRLIMASGQKFAHDTARGIYGENYTRFQAELDEAHTAMDDTSSGQTDYLISLAARMVDEKHDRLEHIVRLWDGEAVPFDMAAMD